VIETTREPGGYQPKVVNDKGNDGNMGIKGLGNRKSKRQASSSRHWRISFLRFNARKTHMVEGTESEMIGEEEVEEG